MNPLIRGVDEKGAAFDDLITADASVHEVEHLAARYTNARTNIEDGIVTEQVPLTCARHIDGSGDAGGRGLPAGQSNNVYGAVILKILIRTRSDSSAGQYPGDIH